MDRRTPATAPLAPAPNPVGADPGAEIPGPASLVGPQVGAGVGFRLEATPLRLRLGGALPWLHPLPVVRLVAALQVRGG